MDLIEGVIFTPLAQISNPKGDIWHVLKSSEPSYKGFGEAYFSNIKFGVDKPWRLHKRMTSNLVVSIGEIHFVLEDGREDSPSFKVKNEFTLSAKNYGRLTIPPGIWMKFTGIGATNSLLNLADIPHDPLESIQR